MDRRTLLALLLTAIVIVSTPIIFPAPRRAPVTDTLAVTDTAAARPPAALPTLPAESPARVRPDTAPRTTTATVPATTSVVPETTLVRTDSLALYIVSPGGTPAAAVLPQHRSLRPGAGEEAPVNLLEPSDRLFRLRFLSAEDTLALDSVPFRPTAPLRQDNTVIRSFAGVASGIPITLTYRIPVDSFVVHVSGRVGDSLTSRDWRLVLQLPTRIRSEEAKPDEDVRSLAVGYKKGLGDVESTWFRDLEAVPAVDTGAIRWVSERNKYYVVVAIPTAPDSTFRAVRFEAGPRVGDEATAANVAALMPTDNGRFGFTIYAGPQSWEHLRATAPDLENVNPYGGWLQGVVQPFATIVMRMLLWMRDTFDVGYGWVLVIFGVAVRLLLWPLNQNAMRSSLQVQCIQPQLAELQQKYKDNPEKQREAMLKLYQEHGMSPFTPVLGCLPMLLPMPILFALYFVFQNTIELRGVSFMWLPDLSLRDPYFITPLFMGLSMFLLSWIGMRGMPPSPQAKMMAYVMPVMFTALFWNFASGLNLYYAVQNVAALPQQWLLSRERRAQTASTPSAVPQAVKGSAKRR